MKEETTFRKLIVSELEGLLYFIAMLEGRKGDLEYAHAEFEELLGEISDYYIPSLLSYPPFANEFTQDEISGISNFRELAHNYFVTKRMKKMIYTPLDLKEPISKLLSVLRDKV